MRFGIRLFSVSAINYCFGNILFAVLWKVFGGQLNHWEIAIICTCVASIFSYQTQSRYLLRMGATTFFSPRYTSFQLFGLLIAIAIVPSLSDYLNLDVILVQFVWSAFFSFVSLLILSQSGFDSSPKL